MLGRGVDPGIGQHEDFHTRGGGLVAGWEGVKSARLAAPTVVFSSGGFDRRAAAFQLLIIGIYLHV